MRRRPWLGTQGSTFTRNGSTALSRTFQLLSPSPEARCEYFSPSIKGTRDLIRLSTFGSATSPRLRKTFRSKLVSSRGLTKSNFEIRTATAYVSEQRKHDETEASSQRHAPNRTSPSRPFFGALSNWLKLQEEYECFFFVADWHALTTHYEDTSSVAENTLQIAMDWLSVGLDPAKSTIFVQSSILEHAELQLLLSMITPLSWLERVPTYKEQIENLKERDLGTYGFLGYPLLQAADIVMYGEAKQDLLVPVGEDQVPHVELAREVVRRFNTAFFEVKKKPSEKQMAVLRQTLDLKNDRSLDR